jgi:diaminohydroxyphosphoribosylaminopyrimidine deaminase/5-amino-6-(5-phosphoribosylamino)uracil reductase
VGDPGAGGEPCSPALPPAHLLTFAAMTFTPADHTSMRQALRLAARGEGWVSPNPMVGAVVVQQGQVVGRGWHRRYGGPHAEVEALRAAGEKARGATLYVTLEPCNHHGKTPPCTEAVLAAGIARVVAATPDPNPSVEGGGAAFLRSRGVQVDVGLLAPEARRLNEAWFHWLAVGRPWVSVKAACSLDGKIATRTGDSQWLTGEAARAFGHRLRHRADAILVGAGTVLADDPQLTTRLPRGRGRDPIRVVLDSRLRLPLTARLLHLNSPAPTWIACTEAAHPEKIRALEAAGAEVLVLPAAAGRVSLRPLLEELGRRRVQHLLVEGGAAVLGACFDEGLVNRFYFFYAPKFLGGREALGVIGGQGVARLAEAHRAVELAVKRLGPDLLVSGRVAGPTP